MRSRLFTRRKDTVLSLDVQARMASEEPKDPTQLQVLVQHFLNRFFNNELASADGEAKARLIQIAFALGLPGMIMALYLYPAYHPPRGTRHYWPQVGDHYFYVVYSLVAMGLITIFEWDFFFPDLVDIFVLTSLPIENWKLFRARVAAIFIFVCGFLFDINFLAPLVLPAAMEPPNLTRLLMAHLVAVTASGIFAAASILTVQSLLLALLGEHLFRKFSLWLQGCTVAALLTLLFLYPVFFGTLNVLLHANTTTTLYIPPFWFLGIYQRLLEGPAVLPVFARLAHIGFAATLLTVLSAVSLYPFAYLRRTRGLVEGAAANPGRNRPGLSFQRALNAIILGNPVSRGISHFISQTLVRVPRYRMYLVMYGGLGVALILAGVVRVNIAHAHLHLALSADGLRAAIPITAFWTVSGLRTVFLSPADQKGTWIFRIIQGRPGLKSLKAASKWTAYSAVAITLGIVSIVFTIAPPELRNWRFAADQAFMAIGLCLFLTDIFYFHVKTIPFTNKSLGPSQNLALILIRNYGFLPPLVWLVLITGPWIEASLIHMFVVIAIVTSEHFYLQSLYRKKIAEDAALMSMGEDEEEFPLRLGLRY
jgi:hypothetical protein